jgi:hypothetical protein
MIIFMILFYKIENLSYKTRNEYIEFFLRILFLEFYFWNFIFGILFLRILFLRILFLEFYFWNFIFENFIFGILFLEFYFWNFIFGILFLRI